MKKVIICFVFFLFVLISGAQVKIIVIDPGHNYDNISGDAKPVRTATEVHTNWEVANKLQDMINNNAYLDWAVHLTRENNDPGSNVSEEERARLAIYYESLAPGKVYFLSIHCNGGGSTGTETFYCNQKFNTNNALLVRYAQNIQDNMVDHGNWTNRRCVEDYTYQVDPTSGNNYHLAVLKTLTMPGCLNEIGFADNNDDSQKLGSDSWRNKFAYAYFNALLETFGDLNIMSYSIINLPCYANNSNYCKISVTLKNIAPNSISGDARAMLRHFPMTSYEKPSSDFCQLGTNNSYFLRPNEEKTFIFDSNIPITMETGMALCIESRPWSGADWDKVHMPTHRDILKVPLNGALIKGVIYNRVLSPQQGAEMYSYQKSQTNSPSQNISSDGSEMNLSSSMLADPSYYDPTTCLSDKDGKYDLLIPSDWGEAVISVKNIQYYSEVLVSPIEDKTLTHNYTTSPIVIGVGSGGGSGNWCGLGPGQAGTSPNNPWMAGVDLNKIEKITLNGQKDFAFICKVKPINVHATNLPFDYTDISHFKYCPPLLVYYRAYIVTFDVYSRTEGCNWFGFSCEENYYFKYFISLIKCDNNLEYIGVEKKRWFEKNLDYYRGVLEEIDLIKDFAQMGIVLNDGDIYKLKIAVSYPEWTERTIYFYVLPENGIFDNKQLAGQYFSNDFKLTNETISSPVTICASKSISIKPSTSINGSFRAYIDQSIDQYACSNTSSLKTLNKDSERVELFTNPNEIPKVNYDHELSAVKNFSLNSCSCLDKQQSVQNFSFNIYPNPTSKIINIEYSNEITNIQSIEIYNSFGRLMFKKTNGFSGLEKLDIENFSPGIYCASLITSKGVFNKFFIKN